MALYTPADKLAEQLNNEIAYVSKRMEQMKLELGLEHGTSESTSTPLPTLPPDGDVIGQRSTIPEALAPDPQDGRRERLLTIRAPFQKSTDCSYPTKQDFPRQTVGTQVADAIRSSDGRSSQFHFSHVSADDAHLPARGDHKLKEDHLRRPPRTHNSTVTNSVPRREPEAPEVPAATASISWLHTGSPELEALTKHDGEHPPPVPSSEALNKSISLGQVPALKPSPNTTESIPLQSPALKPSPNTTASIALQSPALKPSPNTTASIPLQSPALKPSPNTAASIPLHSEALTKHDGEHPPPVPSSEALTKHDGEHPPPVPSSEALTKHDGEHPLLSGERNVSDRHSPLPYASGPPQHIKRRSVSA
ncbi:hypothetical protein Bbelb_024880 [Branchiostoma belcheri]|nr:hypothetical protein Bbelb_024880 [Branchiostoma belcheri]